MHRGGGSHYLASPSFSEYLAVICETFLFVAIFLVMWAATGFSDAFYGEWYNEYSAHTFDMDQYALLGHALIEGKTTLDLPVADGLASLDNPYDYDARVELGRATGEKIFWDHAYYEGAYYSYFGVIPAIVLYMPYELITGELLNTSYAVAFLGVCFIISSSIMVVCLSRRFFVPGSSTAAVMAGIAIVFAGCNVMYLGFVPRFYSVPILMSLVFTFIGIAFWIRARRSDNGIHAEGCLSKSRLFLGSLCMACNLGCRPQFALAWLLAFPLFWREIAKTRMLFSKKGLTETLCGVLPFLLISMPLFAYNYARFGSALDFGSSYNLTGFDMTTYNQTWGTTLLVLYCFILQPISLSSAFPFLNVVDWTWPFSLLHADPLQMILLLLPVVALLVYLGLKLVGAMKAKAAESMAFRRALGFIAVLLIAALIAFATYIGSFDSLGAFVRAAFRFAPHEPMFGGYLWLVPSSLLVLLLPKAKSVLKGAGLWSCCWLMLILAAIVLLVDTRTAGVTQRYFSDFGWYLMLVTVLVFFSLMKTYRDSEQGRNLRLNLLRLFVASMLIVSFVLGGLSMLSAERYDSIASVNPSLYEQLQEPFQSTES